MNIETEDGDEPYSPEDSDEDMPFTPVPVGVSAANIDLAEKENIKREMEELNRQIEAEKMEIALLNTDGDLEPYSPTGALSPSISAEPSNSAMPTLANISIPANIVDILKSIQESSGVNESAIATTSTGYVPSMYSSNPIESGEYIPTSTTMVDNSKSEPSKLAQLSDEELLRLVPDDSL